MPMAKNQYGSTFYQPQPSGAQKGATSPYSSGYTVAMGRQNPMSDVGGMARRAVQSTGNPAAQMYRSMPGMAGMATSGDLASAMGLGKRFQQVANQRNLNSLNTWMSTEPVQAQMQRMQLAANVGNQQADTANQMHQLNDQYRLMQQQRKLNVAKGIYG